MLPLDPDDTPAGDPVPLLVTPADESHGQFSPDGRWLAYNSDDSGRREVYLQEFIAEPSPALALRRVQISTASGSRPRWSPDGDELYYVSPEGELMAVSVTIEAEMHSEAPEMLFALPRMAPAFFPYDVGADGRFLILVSDVQTDEDASVVAVLNWQALLDQ